MRPLACGAAALALGAGVIIAPAQGSPVDPGQGGSAGITLVFDTEVPDRLLELVQGRIIDDDSLDAWVDLPGNEELLRIGAIRGTLSREQLRENLWHTVLGHAGRRGRGLGGLEPASPGALREMLRELRQRRQRIERSVRTHVAAYLPADTGPVEAVIRFHLGGSWSGRTSSAIFVNLTFFQDFPPPRLKALDSVIAHEIIHLVHRRESHLPADGKDAVALFGAGLSQIHAEGVARHVEYGLLRGGHPEGSYGRFARQRYREGLAGFHSAFQRVDRIRTACMSLRSMERCRDLIRSGLSRGGATYVIGHGMSVAIEKALGRGTLASTLVSGPVSFFELYLQATRMLPGFPAPDRGFERDLLHAERALEKGRRVWELQREARTAHTSGRFREAAAILEKLLDLSPGNASGAYNLACALAMSRREKEAVVWLRRSLELGFRDLDLMREDPDLEALREREDYRLLLDPGSSDPPGGSKISR